MRGLLLVVVLALATKITAQHDEIGNHVITTTTTTTTIIIIIITTIINAATIIITILSILLSLSLPLLYINLCLF